MFTGFDGAGACCVVFTWGRDGCDWPGVGADVVSFGCSAHFESSIVFPPGLVETGICDTAVGRCDGAVGCWTDGGAEVDSAVAGAWVEVLVSSDSGFDGIAAGSVGCTCGGADGACSTGGGTAVVSSGILAHLESLILLPVGFVGAGVCDTGIGCSDDDG